MAAKVFTLLTLAFATTVSSFQRLGDRSLVHGIIDASITTDDYVAVVRRQEEGSDESAAKGKSSKGKSKGTGTGTASSGSGGLGSALSSLGMMSSSDLKKGGYSCKKVALLFARGTGEPGNMGFVVGPPLGTQLKKTFGDDILIQGMDYTTDFSGGGAKEMAKYARELFSKCPDTQIVLSGYSQGAMQVHQALGNLGADAGKIAAAVTFGDPYSSMGWGSGGIVGSFMGLGGGGSGGKSGGSSKSSKSSGPKGDPSGAKGDLSDAKGDSSSAKGDPSIAKGDPSIAKGDSSGPKGEPTGVKDEPSGAKGDSKPPATSPGNFNPANGLIICSTGDFVCGVVPKTGSASKGSAPETGGKGGMGGHLSYSSDGSIGKAAAFITKKVTGA